MQPRAPLSSPRSLWGSWSRPALASLLTFLLTLPLAAALSLCAVGEAAASGLEIPGQGAAAQQRGGADLIGIDDPSAVFLNPSLLTRRRGLRLVYSHSLIFNQQSFTRSESQIVPEEGFEAPPGTFSPVENEETLFPLNGFIAASHDFGLEDWSFGVALYGPNGVGGNDYPVSGGQRYQLTRFESLIGFLGVSAAWGRRDFGFGLTFNYATMPYLRYNMVVDGTPDEGLSPYRSSWDVEAALDLEDPSAWNLIAGGWVRLGESFELAGSFRSETHFEARGDFQINNVPGGTPFSDAQLKVNDPSAALDLTLPAIARLGLRFAPNADAAGVAPYDLELVTVWEGWSSFDRFAVDLGGRLNLLANTPVDDVTLEKRWRDTWSLRLGGSAALSETLRLSAGGFFEQGASPREYLNLDFVTLDRFGLAGGVQWALTSELRLLASYSHIFSAEETVSESESRVYQQRPIATCPEGCAGYPGAPANAGRFEASAQLLTFALAYQH